MFNNLRKLLNNLNCVLSLRNSTTMNDDADYTQTSFFDLSDDSDSPDSFQRENDVRPPPGFSKLSLKVPEAMPFKVLIVGEPKVGKTAFAEALQELALRSFSFFRKSFNENAYQKTTQIITKYIPVTTSLEIKQRPLIDYIRDNKFSKSFELFATKPHGRQKLLVMDNDKLYKCSMPQQNQVFDEILISEFPSTTDEISVEVLAQFDKIIIMTEYSDINTMRSAFTWSTKLKLPKDKTIICVNKCDEQALSFDDDFQSRKAQIMNYFDSQCAVEYISVKTRANLGFIYKYM